MVLVIYDIFETRYMNRTEQKPNHASFNGDGRRGYFDWFHVEEDRMLFVIVRLRQQRMKQDSTSRVDQESVGQSAEMEVNDRTEQRIDWYIDASDTSKGAPGDDWQTRRGHHSYEDNRPEEL